MTYLSAYEPARLTLSELEDLNQMIREELEFSTLDGGPLDGFKHEWTMFRREDHSYGIKCKSTEKYSGEVLPEYYGTVLKCEVCKSLVVVFDDPDEWCPGCQAPFTHITHRK